jgi:hypothetical protein
MKPGSSLAEAVNNLQASDIVQYGARAYPIVRQPGEVDLYEVDADDVTLPYEQVKFTTKLVCTIQSKSTLAQRLKEKEAREAAVKKKDDAANATAKDGCGSLRNDVPAWAACEERQKQERLKRVQDSMHTAIQPSDPAKQ